MRFLLSLFCLFSTVTAALAYDIPIRGSEPTFLEFSKPIKHAGTRQGINASFETKEANGKSILIITPTDAFSSGSILLAFEDGSTGSVTIFADPTASTTQAIRAEDVTISTGAATTTQAPAPAQPAPLPAIDAPPVGAYTIPEVPAGTADILDFLNRLEEAEKVSFRYSRSLPAGLRGLVTRVLDTGAKYMYEVEVENFSKNSVLLTARMFSHYLTDAVSIPEMDQFGKMVLRPNATTYVYISDIHGNMQ